MNICVHTSPGRRGEAEPHVFFVGGRRLIVASILDRWSCHPQHFYQVRCDDGRGFLLCFDVSRRSWELACVYAASLRPKRPPVFAAAAPAALPSAPSLGWEFAPRFIARWWR